MGRTTYPDSDYVGHNLIQHCHSNNEAATRHNPYSKRLKVLSGTSVDLFPDADTVQVFKHNKPKEEMGVPIGAKININPLAREIERFLHLCVLKSLKVLFLNTRDTRHAFS